MTAIDVAQQYFESWNRRDPAAVLATMAEGGTYTDPGTHGPVSGQAFAAYMQGLFAAFPDVSFAIASARSRAPIRILDVANVATSFPDFPGVAQAAGLTVRVQD